MSELPIACDLTAGEVARRASELLPGLIVDAHERQAVPGGFRWRFMDEPGALERIAAVVAAERGCCRFLRFQVEVEPATGPIWLEVTGPEGTSEFLSEVTEDVVRDVAKGDPHMVITILPRA